MPEKKTQLTRGDRSKAQEKEAQDAFVQAICKSMDDAATVLNSGEKITLDKIDRPEKPKQLTASEIADIRAERLNLSQSVFALLLNVSLKTVQAWEQSQNKPSGATLRLLNLVREHPDDLKAFILGDLRVR